MNETCKYTFTQQNVPDVSTYCILSTYLLTYLPYIHTSQLYNCIKFHLSNEIKLNVFSWLQYSKSRLLF